MADRRCPSCTSGHGGILNLGKLRCPVCNDEHHYRSSCRECRGRGWVKCDTCQGRGYVPDDQDITDPAPIISLWGGRQDKKARRRRKPWWRL